jgi:small-conductance mechanosensitive channel
MHLLEQLIPLIPQMIWGLFALIPFIMGWFFAKLLFTGLKKKTKANNPLIVFFEKTINVIIIAIAIITVLGTWGLDVRALLAGLGLTGFALGFALKDVLASLVAGVLILFYRPFKLHSIVSIMGVEGEVIDIDLRYTTLKSGDEQHLIPNSKLISEKITILKTGK